MKSKDSMDAKVRETIEIMKSNNKKKMESLFHNINITTYYDPEFERRICEQIREIVRRNDRISVLEQLYIED